MIFEIETTRDHANIEALSICKRLGSIVPDKSEELIFDFSQYRETNPFSNLILINALKEIRTSYPDVLMRVRAKGNDTYLQHIGFYKAIGIAIGKEPGEAVASPNYVPITPVVFDYNFYRNIEHLSDQLACTIHFDERLQTFLSYIFQETIRNVYEHAETNKALVAAQNWPTKNMVEVAIVDAGCGIASTLRKRFAKDDLGLLRFALRPGITAGSNFGFFGKDEPWRNSGYGLFNMQQATLACDGSFIICSDGYALRYSIENGELQENVYETAYTGTALGLRFRTDIVKDFDKLFYDIKVKGELLAAQTEGAIRSSSKSSSGRYKLKL